MPKRAKQLRAAFRRNCKKCDFDPLPERGVRTSTEQAQVGSFCHCILSLYWLIPPISHLLYSHRLSFAFSTLKSGLPDRSLSILASPVCKTYSSGVLNPRYVYYMCIKDIMNGFYPALTICIFLFQHTSINCGVNTGSHGSEPREILLIYKYLLYVWYL